MSRTKALEWDFLSCHDGLQGPSATLVYTGEDFEVPGKDSGNAFPSLCFCGVSIKKLYISIAE